MDNQRPELEQALKRLSPASDRTWLAGLTAGLAMTLIAAYVHTGPTSGQFWVYAGLLVRLSLYLRAGEAQREHGGLVIATLLRLGLVAGLFELLVDWWLVNGVSHGKLVYLGSDVVLLASPLWMPLAWACVIVELGYPALRLYAWLVGRMSRRRAAVCSSIFIGVQAGIMVGFYEYFAALAGWWKYQPAHHMIGSYCALFIPLGEAFMFAALLPIAARTLSRGDKPTAAAVEGGALFAAAIALGYALAYALLEVGGGG